MSAEPPPVARGDDVSFGVRVVADRENGAVAYMRKHRLETGPALSFDREEPRATALELVLAAIGSDVATGLVRLARRRRLDLEVVEANVRAWLDNPLTWLGVVGEEGTPGLKRVRARFYVSTVEATEAVRKVWEEALATSPLVCTFRRTVELDLSLKTID